MALVPQGGNTGLVGGGVPLHGEVVLGLGRLDTIGEVDPLSAQVTAGAGVTLAAVQAAAAEHGLLYPVDLAARDQATVGGTVATNAGGVHLLRWGGTRRQLLGVEAVLADGRIAVAPRRAGEGQHGLRPRAAAVRQRGHAGSRDRGAAATGAGPDRRGRRPAGLHRRRRCGRVGGRPAPIGPRAAGRRAGDGLRRRPRVRRVRATPAVRVALAGAGAARGGVPGSRVAARIVQQRGGARRGRQRARSVARLAVADDASGRADLWSLPRATTRWPSTRWGPRTSST